MPGGDRHLLHPELRKCRECGAEFTALHYQHLYCSHKCRSRYKRLQYWDDDWEQKGDGMNPGIAAEMLVCTDLLKRSIQPYHAVSSHAPFDLIATYGTSMWRIQVRKGRHIRGATRVGFQKGKGAWHEGTDVLAIAIIKDPMSVYYFKPRGSIYRMEDEYAFWLEARHDHHAIEGGSE